MNSWDNYRFMLALVQGKTMAAAARSLGIDVATVSRRIEKLNELFGRPVFVKKSEGWSLAPEFEDLAQMLVEFSERLTSMRNSIVQGGTEQITQVVIGCPPMIASAVLLPSLRTELSPPPNIQFTFTHRIFEDGLGDCDIVIRFGRPEAGRIVTRRAGTVEFSLYKQRAQRLGKVWAGLTPPHDNYGPMQLGFQKFGCPPKIRVDQIEHLLIAVEANGLPAPLPDVMTRGKDLLERVPDTYGFSAEFWLLYHEARQSDPALRQCVDWIIRAFRHAEGKTP
ncbi:LysR family transcriptional regulator [Thioclava sp. FR2]|uniref:LysR family transcriptional regulator n=1 Tax=Thioclava sp. FR2 TaxID=3445780 RepID=UPI003EBCC3FF